MAEEYFANDWVHMFVAELTSGIVAKSGIPSDRFHLGKIILQSLKDDPDFVLQIDGATGQSETNGSVLKRTIQCAISLKQMGLKQGDVMVLMAPNHLDLAIPFYAGWYLGLAVAPTDRTMNTHDLKHSFEVIQPKIVFCQNEDVQHIKDVIKFVGTDTIVISFDNSALTLNFSEMLKKYGSEVDVQDFKVTDFDPDETIALLISTSGTTGLSKATAITHKNMAISAPYAWCFSTKFPSPTRSALLLAPLDWLSTLVNYVRSPLLKFTRVQSSTAITPQVMIELTKKYQPTFFTTSPTMLSTLLQKAEEQKCDFSSYELIYVAGSAVFQELLDQMKRLSPKTIVQDTYGMTELGGVAFQSIGAPRGSCGKRLGHLQYRLVDMESKEDIKEPNKWGELWLKGPGVFKGYYNDPVATKEAFAEDGWFMTGDLMYRDENWNFYFVERIKLLLKNHEISPVELETVIRQHPGVVDVAVTSLRVVDYGDVPVACVVPRPGCQPTAQEIKDLVKEKLSDAKQLRGGVLFMSELPLTSSTKLHRRKLKEIVMERKSELHLEKDTK